jgi:TatD DNase family protein
MELIDTHCHLDLPVFDHDREQVLGRAVKRGVKRIIVPGINAAGWPRLLTLCQSHAALYPALGLHPLWIERHRAADLVELEARLAQRQALAVGEIGLDFYVKDLDRHRQAQLFERQLAIAVCANLPVLLHVRKAHEPVLAALRRIRPRGGIAHAFNGSLQQAEQYLDLGFKLGFGGMLTYERSHKLHRLAQQLPPQALVLETDAPDMSGASHRGERNSPEYLPDHLAALARWRDQDLPTLAAATTVNACAALGLTPPGNLP